MIQARTTHRKISHVHNIRNTAFGSWHVVHFHSSMGIFFRNYYFIIVKSYHYKTSRQIQRDHLPVVLTSQPIDRVPAYGIQRCTFLFQSNYHRHSKSCLRGEDVGCLLQFQYMHPCRISQFRMQIRHKGVPRQTVCYCHSLKYGATWYSVLLYKTKQCAYGYVVKSVRCKIKRLHHMLLALGINKQRDIQLIARINLTQFP